MKYRMYVDEVGNPDLESSANPLHRFLSLTGVIVDLDYVRRTLHPEMERLKTSFFGSHPDDPVIFHRNEILKENIVLDSPVSPFGTEVIRILQCKYYEHGGRTFGKKFI
jgi:hypothetical protein